MAVTTTYSFQFVATPTIYGSDNTDVVGLAGGGMSVASNDGGGLGVYYNSGFGPYIGFDFVSGFNLSTSQLTNGNILLVGEDGAGNIDWTITNTSSAVIGSGNTGGANESVADVAGLAGGGFVIVDQRNFSATDNDIYIHIRDASGASVNTVAVSGSGDNDRNASVAGLADGGFAVAFTRDDNAGHLQAWTEVFNADGTVRTAAFDFDGAEINDHMSVVALQNGGYAVAYDDTGWAHGREEITLARFNSSGSFLGYTEVTAGASSDDTNPYATVLSNGLIAISYSHTFSVSDHDVYMQLVDPTTGALLLTNPFSVDSSGDEQLDTASAGVNLAGVATTWTDVTTGFVNAEVNQLVRTSTGDGSNDTVNGDDAIDNMFGNAGDDTLRGFANNDYLDGGANNDQLFGGDGNDTVVGGAGNDTMDGGNGTDLLDYSAMTTGVAVSLALTGPQNTGTGAGTDTVVNFENLTGGSGSDTLTGDANANTIIGNNGNDHLNGGGGNDYLNGGANTDTLSGGNADDYLVGGTGNDTIDGGNGVDTVDYVGSVGAVTVSLAVVVAQNTGSFGTDTITNVENITSGDYNDKLTGNTIANVIHGGGGNDSISALNGNDVLFGEAGGDTINGGKGHDVIDGGAGQDHYIGGLDQDNFIFAQLSDSGVGAGHADRITDFSHAEGDLIDLSAVYGGTLSYIGSSVFGGVGNAEVRVGTVTQGQLVSVDANGDGTSDMDILVSNSGIVGASDFVL